HAEQDDPPAEAAELVLEGTLRENHGRRPDLLALAVEHGVRKRPRGLAFLAAGREEAGLDDRAPDRVLPDGLEPRLGGAGGARDEAGRLRHDEDVERAVLVLEAVQPVLVVDLLLLVELLALPADLGLLPGAPRLGAGRELAARA